MGSCEATCSEMREGEKSAWALEPLGSEDMVGLRIACEVERGVGGVSRERELDLALPMG